MPRIDTWRRRDTHPGPVEGLGLAGGSRGPDGGGVVWGLVARAAASDSILHLFIFIF